MIDLQAERSGAGMTHAEARVSVIDVVIPRVNPPKKSKSAQSEDTSGHLRSEKSLAPENLSWRDIEERKTKKTPQRSAQERIVYVVGLYKLGEKIVNVVSSLNELRVNAEFREWLKR